METLTATLTITEDMAGDGSVLTAARFQWLIGKGMEEGRREDGLQNTQNTKHDGESEGISVEI